MIPWYDSTVAICIQFCYLLLYTINDLRWANGFLEKILHFQVSLTSLWPGISVPANEITEESNGREHPFLLHFIPLSKEQMRWWPLLDHIYEFNSLGIFKHEDRRNLCFWWLHRAHCNDTNSEIYVREEQTSVS